MQTRGYRDSNESDYRDSDSKQLSRLSHYRYYRSALPTMGVFVFRRVQEGYHGEPAITREQKHFSKIHESDCKPSTCLACSYLNWREVCAAFKTF